MDEMDHRMRQLAEQLQNDLEMMRMVTDAHSEYEKAIIRARAAYVSTVMSALGVTVPRRTADEGYAFPDLTAPWEQRQH